MICKIKRIINQSAEYYLSQSTFQKKIDRKTKLFCKRGSNKERKKLFDTLLSYFFWKTLKTSTNQMMK